MFMIVLFCIVNASLLLLFSKYYKTRIHKCLSQYPGPDPFPVVGNALEFTNSREFLKVLMRHAKTYGTMFKVQIGPARLILVALDYKFFEFILSSSKTIEKSIDYHFFYNWLGTGLLTSGGPKWKGRRRIITPTFHFKILEQFIEVFEKNGTIMLEKFKKQVGQQSVDVYNNVSLCTLDIICETAMGTSIKAQSNSDSDYVKNVREMSRITLDRAFSPLKMYDSFYKFSFDYYKERDAVKSIHAHTDSVINQRREELKRKGNQNNDDDIGIKKKVAFLDLLLEVTVDGKPLSKEDIREEVDTFMFEGHDTTASAISFALYCLSNNSDAQEKAFKEQKEIFGDEFDRPVTYGDLQNMKYLEMVIKETLRLYPSVPFYGRQLLEDIEYDGKILPKGLSIVILAFGIQRDARHHRDPENFIPERFEEYDGSKPYAYVPFSAGPRNCIGQKFAMLEMKSTLSKVIRNLELIPATPTHTLELAAETVLKSANGIRVAFKNR